MAKVFISYRRVDDYGGVGRMFDRLEAHYQPGNVFMDVDSNMPLGIDFRSYITGQVRQADIVLAIIGPNWLRLIQEKAEDPLDYVRLELEVALERRIPVVPVLLGGEIAVPPAHQLPASIRDFAFLSGLVLDPRQDFRLHVDRLIRRLDQTLEHVANERAQASANPVPAPPAVATPAPAPATPQNVTDSLGLEMIWCPPGKFLMGSPATENERQDCEHQHEVALSKGFWISRYQVTQRQWETLMGSNPSRFKASGPDAPVERVNWDQCVELCRKLSEREGQSLPSGYAYRLPTEAQWEYACRAGTTTPFHFGAVLDGTQANCDGPNPYGIQKKGPYLKKTTKVGSYPPNAWGLHDMHGNVWEWCLDWYGEYEQKAVTDPTGPKQATLRVIRGGSWDDNARFCRSACRSHWRPGLRDSNLGFRPVRSA